MPSGQSRAGQQAFDLTQTANLPVNSHQPQVQGCGADRVVVLLTSYASSKGPCCIHCACRLLPQWVAAGDHPKSCTSLLQQLPAANAGALRLIMQTCSYINEQAAVNEMDSQALAEVLAHVVAWKPAPKPERSTGQGPWQGLTKALTLHRGAAAAGDSGTTPPVEAGDAAGAAEGAQESVATLSLSDAAADVQRVTPLDDAELEAIVTVLEYVISNFGTVFGAFT